MIYLIYGANQTPLVNKEINKIIKQNNIVDDGFSIVNYDGSETPLVDIISDATTMPFMSDNKAVIVRKAEFFGTKAISEEDSKVLSAYLSSPSPFTSLIFHLEGKIDEKKDIVKQLKQVATVIKIDDVEKDQWPIVIKQLIQKAELDMDYDAINEFIDRCSGNLETVIQELGKLKLYNGHISKDVVEQMIPRPLEDNMFGMVDAILNNNLDAVMAIYHDLKLQNNDTSYLIPALASQFRFLYQVGYLSNKGLSNDEIASSMSNVKSGRVYYALKKINNHSLNDLLAILDELATLDYEVKSGLKDKNMALELFLISTH